METRNDKDLCDARLKLFKEIIAAYENRTNYQKDIAEKYNMPVEVIAQVLKYANFARGRLKIRENLRDGEKINLMIIPEELKFLDPYLPTNTMKNY